MSTDDVCFQMFVKVKAMDSKHLHYYFQNISSVLFSIHLIYLCWIRRLACFPHINWHILLTMNIPEVSWQYQLGRNSLWQRRKVLLQSTWNHNWPIYLANTNDFLLAAIWYQFPKNYQLIKSCPKVLQFLLLNILFQS